MRDDRPGAGEDTRHGRVWDRALQALALIEVGKTADGALRKVESKARDLGASERQQLREMIFSLLRNRRAVEDRLQRAARAERRDLNRIEPPLAQRLLLVAHRVAESGSLVEAETVEAGLVRRFGGLLRRIATDRLPPSKRDALEAHAIDYNLPTWILERWVDRLGSSQATAVAEALRSRGPLTVYVKSARGSDGTSIEDRDAVLEKLRSDGLEAAKTELSPFGLRLPLGTDLSPLPMRARLEVQDEGSQLVALAAAMRGTNPDCRILDACAGAGGKTLVLLDRCPGAEITAVEPDANKYRELLRRLPRREVTTERSDLEGFAKRHPSSFDVVLVDAPCTGTGTLRRHPELAHRLTPERLELETTRQKLLVASAYEVCRPGGVLVYATCSVFAEENEDIADYAGEHLVGVQPISVFGEPEGATTLPQGWKVRIGPGPTSEGPDGFFIAAFQKGP